MDHVPFNPPIQTLPNLAALAQAAGKPVFVFDLEATTGDLKDPQFGIVEIGWVRIFADARVEQGSMLIDAKQPMNPYASKLTGITRKLYAGQPDFQARWPLIEPMVMGSLCSGFGIHDMDCKALFHSAQGFLGEGARFQIDSLDARTLWIGHSGSQKGQLSEVAKAFGHDEGKMHRALADARAAAAALEGLAKALGPKACLKQTRRLWDPLAAIDKALELALANEAALAGGLAKTRGSADFLGAVSELDAMGLRAHHAVKGFSWWRGNHRVELEGAPSSPAELAAHFGAAMPEGLEIPDTLVRCEALLASERGAGMDDAQTELACLCKSPGSAGAARAKAIRHGTIAPWTGVAASMRAFAEASASELESTQDERSVLEGLRSRAPPELKLSDGLNAAAASLARQLGCPPPKPRGPKP